MAIKRYESVIRIKPRMLEKYKSLHQTVWPDVLNQIKLANIQNYSIFLKDKLLFSYFEYTGEDFQKDMRLMSEDPATQAWWSICKPCQTPLHTRLDGEWWAVMEEVFHSE